MSSGESGNQIRQINFAGTIWNYLAYTGGSEEAGAQGRSVRRVDLGNFHGQDGGQVMRAHLLPSPGALRNLSAVFLSIAVTLTYKAGRGWGQVGHTPLRSSAHSRRRHSSLRNVV